MLKDSKKWEGILWILFVGLIIPILYIGRYNVISADDYAYGLEVHRNWIENHSLFQAIGTAFEVVANRYMTWQGTYTSVFFMSLNPLNFHNGAGWLIPLFMISMLCLSTGFFFKQSIACITGNKVRGGIVVRGIALLYLLMFIQSLTSPVEGFFWYNGAVHYILMHSFMLFYLGLFLKLQKGVREKMKTVAFLGQTLLLCILGVLIGGGNYISALQCMEVGIVIVAAGFLFKKLSIAQIVGFLTMAAGFVASVAAPGNALRQAGTNGMSVPSAIFSSFIMAVKDVKEWVNPLLIFFLLIIIPFLWQLAKEIPFDFRYPLIAAILCYCLYASLYAPCLYGVGNVDSGRMRNVIQASFYIYLLVGELYILGALQRRIYKSNKEWSKDMITVITIGQKYVWLYRIILLAGIVCVLVLTGDKNTYTSMSALRSVAIGEAQIYYEENLERQAIIAGEEQDIYLEPLSVKPHVLYFADYVTKEDPNNWINRTAARYYNKNSIQLVD